MIGLEDYYIENINGYTFRMRYLPGGIFPMGDPQNQYSGTAAPLHEVDLSPYYIGEYQVTQGLWKAVMGADQTPSRFLGDKRPVESVSWIDIMEGNQKENGQPAFIDRINDLTKHTRLGKYVYTLPSEAQWEYAARAGTKYKYAGSDQLKEVGWYDHNSYEETKEVGLLLPNDFGLYDMSGNVEEWCLDFIDNEYYQKCVDRGLVKDPVNLDYGQYRVSRGGFWGNGAGLCRVFYRYFWRPTDRLSVGFRLVLALVQ